MTDTKTPTPLERLEAWVDADPRYRLAAPRYCEHGWSVCLTIEEPYRVIWPDESPTLDEAILAALEQANGGTE